MVYLNGHLLPYSSAKYPLLAEEGHGNCKKEFFSKMLLYAKQRGMNIIAVLSITGHAGGFATLYPSSKIEIKKEVEILEENLILFPGHIRKGKTTRKNGSAQVGCGALCHHKKLSRQYAEDVINAYMEII